MSLAGAPDPATPVPAAVRAYAAGRPCTPVWENQLGGLTFAVGEGEARCFVKWQPHGRGRGLRAEWERLAWAVQYTPVPRVIASGEDAEAEWFATAPHAGENAVSERWKAAPRTAVRALGAGLRALHDALPVDGCPFTWSREERLAVVRERAAQGLLTPADWHPDLGRLTVESALALLEDAPAVDRLVVCHGDACAPNTLIGADGGWTAHVDLGALGVADRWADIAIATWSTEWNYGPGWEGDLLDAYGIAPDPVRTAYYRLLWDLGP